MIPTGLSGRGSWVWFAVAVTVAGVGFFSAASPDPERLPRVTAEAAARQMTPAGLVAAAPVGVAPSYTELRDLRRGDNGAMYSGATAALVGAAADAFTVLTKTPADWTGALVQRATRRAYAGAPPTIPHPIAQLATNACLACHEAGAIIGGRVAPRMAHDHYQACTQCHVPSVDPRPWNGPTPGASGSGALALNDFSGLDTFGRGTRAQPGAPPTVPHPTKMRARCDTCHGPKGLLGLRTPHPYRQSCSQCHLPSAVLDQRIAFRTERP